MKAKSLHGTSPHEIQKAFQTATADGFNPTLALVFLSKSLDYKAFVKVFDDAKISVFGLTTNGEFIDENTFDKSCSVMLLDIDRNHFDISFEAFQDRNFFETAQRLTEKSTQKIKNPGFLLGSCNMHTDAEEILRGIASIIGPQVNVFGAIAGDEMSFEGGFVFTNDRQSESAMILLALDEDNIEFKGRATCGWHAVGTLRTVTKSEGNHVYTVDDIPVLDLTAKYGGLENVTPENEKLFFEIAATLPLQLQREKGDPLMRPGLKIDWDDHSYYCSGSVPQGSKVRFSIPPDFDVVEKVINSAQDLKDTEMPEADAVIVFSCVGRFLSFGPMINMELEGVKNVWNAPMAGMFSNAELGRATGGNLEMHNLTAIIVALKGK